MTKQIVSIDTNEVQFQAFTYAGPFTRIFFCNSILFVNSGTGNVFINDVFTLFPGASLSLDGNQNEIDTTVYKVAFAPGFTNSLQVWVKGDKGVQAIVDAKVQYPAGKIINRRAAKKFKNQNRRGGNF